MAEKNLYCIGGGIPEIYQNSILSAYLPRKNLITALSDSKNLAEMLYFQKYHF